jgi:hypothetical protein
MNSYYVVLNTNKLLFLGIVVLSLGVGFAWGNSVGKVV